MFILLEEDLCNQMGMSIKGDIAKELLNDKDNLEESLAMKKVLTLFKKEDKKSGGSDKCREESTLFWVLQSLCKDNRDSRDWI